MDFAPPGASQPLVKPIDVDDVPIVALTLSGKPGTNYDDAQLRLVADHMLDELRKVPGVGNSLVIGGRSRQVRVTLDPQRIAGYGLSPLQISQAITRFERKPAFGRPRAGEQKTRARDGRVLREGERCEKCHRRGCERKTGVPRRRGRGDRRVRGDGQTHPDRLQSAASREGSRLRPMPRAPSSLQ